ncbi:MAG: hypothetical protein WCE20_12015 [Rhizomicrobium sp.]
MSAAINTLTGAGSVILIRHAEKTGQPDDIDLSEIGLRRAALLAQALPTAFGKIDTIIAAKSSARSSRPLLTVQPLALAPKKQVMQNWDTDEYSELANALTSEGSFNGQQILVCWRHKSLDKLAMALGSLPAAPWPEEDYEHMIAIRRRPDIHTVWYRQIWDGRGLQIIESESY